MVSCSMYNKHIQTYNIIGNKYPNKVLLMDILILISGFTIQSVI